MASCISSQVINVADKWHTSLTWVIKSKLILVSLSGERGKKESSIIREYAYPDKNMQRGLSTDTIPPSPWSKTIARVTKIQEHAYPPTFNLQDKICESPKNKISCSQYSQTIFLCGWDDNACLGVRNINRIEAWPNSLDQRPPRYCIVSPLLQTNTRINNISSTFNICPEKKNHCTNASYHKVANINTSY